MTTGDRIRKLREKRGLTQMKLCVAVGVSHNQISLWELNKQKPSYENLVNLARALETTISSITGHADV